MTVPNKDNDTPVKDVVEKPEDVKPVDEAPPSIDPDPDPPKDDLRDLVKNLADKVDGLENTIASIVETGGERDSTPGGKAPWTHRRFL